MSVTYETSGPRYLEARPGPARTDSVAIFGVPYDGTTSFRPGTRFGPNGLRLASVGIETYSWRQDRDMVDLDVVDLGDLVIPFGAPEPVVDEAEEAVRDLLAQGAFPVMLGGEHSISAGPVAAMAERYPDLAVVQFDAHADLRNSYLGSLNSHACAMRRALDHLEPSGPMLQIGIRSGTRAEWQEMRTANRYVPGHPEAVAAALPRLGERPIYLTIDLDVFDPAHLPGTGTPEAGGLDWPTFVGCLQALPGQRIVGIDVMELTPDLDPTGRSQVLAAKVVREAVLHARG